MMWVKSIPGDTTNVAVSSKLLVGYASFVDVRNNRVLKAAPPEETLADFQLDFNQIITSLSVSDNDFVRIWIDRNTKFCFLCLLILNFRNE
jgi:hypothetical protein